MVSVSSAEVAIVVMIKSLRPSPLVSPISINLCSVKSKLELEMVIPRIPNCEILILSTKVGCDEVVDVGSDDGN